MEDGFLLVAIILILFLLARKGEKPQEVRNDFPRQKNPMTHQIVMFVVILLSFVVVLLNSK